MARVKPWAEFRSGLPTDVIEDEHDFVQYGGRPVALAISEILRRMGAEVDPRRAGTGALLEVP